ncbi:penicillin-binding protein [Glycomyces buryatensis]|uniref:Penicillin-binding protein n=2 Tax=Glycomyces buryatensis TaxID=2570927 RepID=A0A4S8QCC3_9ACTN|nr:penicillin-binding protein [Glycomyces buryatensis]
MGKLPEGGDDFFSGSENTGRASVTGRRAAIASEDELAPGGKKKKKRMRRKVLASLIAMGVVMVAAVTVVGAYFFQEIDGIESVRRLGESSTFYYADGETEAGGYGQNLHLEAKSDEIPASIKEALVALEDRKFYEHSGVDYMGTMRAVLNNVTGGDTQGASTITQQYAGMVLDARDEISYDRKAREAAMAMQIESEYEKDEIITSYLNLAFFGRGAYGIASAAEVYFNKELKELDYAQSAFLVMQVKSPNGTYDEWNEDYYDEGATSDRWNHAMDALVEEGYISQGDRDKAEQPVPEEKYESRGSWGGDTNMGFIVNEQDGYVFDELYEHYGLTQEDLFGGVDENGKVIKPGGFQVTLTVDKAVQDSLANTGSRGEIRVKTNEDGEYLDENDEVVDDIDQAAKDTTDEGYAQFVNDNEDAALEKYPEYMTTAMVATDPATGNVLGYYGGDDGFGVDKAGAESPHPPSSTFKMITAATAIEGDHSIDSWWDSSSPRPFDSLTLEEQEECIGSGTYPDCTLLNGGHPGKSQMTLTDAVRNSRNTPMYAIAEDQGANTILDYADKMGLETMNQSRQVDDADGKTHDVSVNYQLNGDGTYTVLGKAIDAEGNPIVGADNNWDTYALLEVDDECNPTVVDADEQAMAADEDGEANTCEIGGKSETDPFYNHIAFGQYPTSVRDMSSIYATIANDGVYNESRFVAKVVKNDGTELNPTVPYESGKAFDAGVARDLQYVGSEIKGESTSGEDLGRDYFGKTGTWEASGEDENGEKYDDGYNAHAWYVGAIKQLSIAAWVGNITSESDPIADEDGNKLNVFGSNTAYPVWFDAMTKILDKKEGDDTWDEVKWEEPEKVGSADTDDIVRDDGTIDPNLQYCQQHGDDERCGDGKDEDEDLPDDECEDEDSNSPDCQETTPTEDPTTDPTEGPTGECSDWDPLCEEPTDEPTDDGGGGGEESMEPEEPANPGGE